MSLTLANLLLGDSVATELDVEPARRRVGTTPLELQCCPPLTSRRGSRQIWEVLMPFDTLLIYVGTYGSVDDAIADYDAVHALHTELDLIDAYDAAVVERRDNGKVKVVKKHETPTRVGGVAGGGLGLATGLVIALFPAAAIGTGLLAGTAAGGAVLGALAGHAAAGMKRSDLKELGEQLDEGQAGLVVVAASDIEAKIEHAMHKADKIATKQLEADLKELERDAKADS